jgi:peptidoglycan/LPS O-acetylase OafA/YrhL
VLPNHKNRIHAIDMLRGVAALMVCIFHFTNGNKNYLPNGYWLKTAGQHGWVGVEIFFIISGFIIPYSLYKTNYTYATWKNFLLKRFCRIEPPYFVTICLVLLLNYISTLSPYFKGKAMAIDYQNLLLHIGYLNSFFNEPWLNPVFWTLAIEFQFYILMALAFPLLMWPSKALRIVLIAAFILTAWLSSANFIFHYSLYFSIGILLFIAEIYVTDKMKLQFLCIPLIIFIYLKHGVEPGIASLFAWIILVYFKDIKHKWLLFIGMVSYSLYLIHVPIGGRMINMSTNFISLTNGRAGFIVITIGAMLVASYIFYRLVELPALKFSQKIGKKNTKA